MSSKSVKININNPNKEKRRQQREEQKIKKQKEEGIRNRNTGRNLVSLFEEGSDPNTVENRRPRFERKNRTPDESSYNEQSPQLNEERFKDRLFSALKRAQNKKNEVTDTQPDANHGTPNNGPN